MIAIESAVSDPAEIQRILHERAEALACSPEQDDAGDGVELVIVSLGRERYGIALEYVREIKPLDRVTPLAATPVFWLGLANLRGNLYSVLDLRRYLGLQGGVAAVDPQLVLVQGAAMTVGVRVDEVIEVRTVAQGEIGPSLIDRGARCADVHVGLTRDLVSVLDIQALLSDRTLVVQEGFDLS